MTFTNDRPYKIDGYPVTRQEVLDQATIISGRTIRSIPTAKRILAEDGREVTEKPIGTPFSEMTPERFTEIGRSWGYD